MSIFKKMAQMGQKITIWVGFGATQKRAEFTNELCVHLRQLGVNATAVDPRTVESISIDIDCRLVSSTRWRRIP